MNYLKKKLENWIMKDPLFKIRFLRKVYNLSLAGAKILDQALSKNDETKIVDTIDSCISSKKVSTSAVFSPVSLPSAIPMIKVSDLPDEVWNYLEEDYNVDLKEDQLFFVKNDDNVFLKYIQDTTQAIMEDDKDGDWVAVQADEV